MNEAIKNETIEQLDKDICFGFENANELFESISEMFHDVEDYDEVWLKKEIETRLKKHQTESLTWEKPTDFEKLAKAFDELNKQGIVSLHKAGYTRQDGENDCLEIIEELKALNIKVKGYCYYHTQDLERAIGNEKMLFIGYDSYNQEDKLAEEVAQDIVKMLKHNGLHPKWNGSLNSRIEVLDINWQKIVDDIDYNYDRVFNLIYINNNISSKPKKKIAKPFWKFW